MSLTTAISDDEIDHSSSPVSTRPINSAASFNCTGAVRKAGFLSVKKWIIRKKHKVELARKRGWKGYWVLQCFSYFLSWDIVLVFLESSCNVFYELKSVKNAQNDLKFFLHESARKVDFFPRSADKAYFWKLYISYKTHWVYILQM